AVHAFMQHAYFQKPPPKSLDRDSFRMELSCSPEQGAATLTAITAASIAGALQHFPEPPLSYVICGGGRHNPLLMRMLNQRAGRPVVPIEALGHNGDATEAEAFAYLAVRSIRGLPLSFPGTTGASH